MWINIFLILSTLETTAVFVFNLLQGSSADAQIFLNYSLERLAVLAFLLAAALFLAYLSLHSFKKETKTSQWIARAADNATVLWGMMVGGLLLSALIFYLFIQPDAWFGGYLVLFQRLSSILFWLLVLSLQSLFFALVWYGARFTEKGGQVKDGIPSRELNVVVLIFLLTVLVKLVFLLPNCYGLYKDVGESKYFNMIYYLHEGIFLDSADDVTTHYPFLYPLMLLFTYSVKNYTFLCILLANFVFASSIVFPLYLLGRRVLNRMHSLILIAIASLIPFQFLIPNRILSENLYFPLLLWCLYLAFTRPQDDKQRLAWDCLTGVAFGLLYLTRFISLAVIPFLLLIWWLKPFAGVERFFQLNGRKIFHALLMVLLTALVYYPWVRISLNNGLTFKEALGFGITATTNAEQLTLSNLLIWMLFYAAYYILLAAPVFNLVIIVFKRVRDWKLEDERGRWLASLGWLMAAFGAAVVRHSWRAFYNLEQPERIMGRYVIYFVPLFLLTGLLGLESFRREDFKDGKRFALTALGLPAVLVVFSYLLVVSGNLITINPGFLQAEISIDGFYIKTLGGWFFVLLAALYGVSAYGLWHGKHRTGLLLAALLALFYLWGEPVYMDYLDARSTYQKMGYTISEIILQNNQTAGEALDYTVYLSDGLDVDDRKDLTWSLYVRNLESDFEIVRYPAAEKPELGADEAGFVVYPVEEQEAGRGGNLYAINGVELVVEVKCHELLINY